jgi:hypothetical protein
MTVRAATGSVSVGAGETETQIVRVGFAVQAVFLWWSREAEDGAAPTNQGGMGVAAAGSEEAGVCWAAAGNELGWWSGDAALIGFPDPRGVLEPELRASITWLDDGFALDHSVPRGGRWHVRYLSLGGDDPFRAAVRRFEIEREGPITVRGLGFEPSLLLFLPGAGRDATTSFPGLMHGIGAATGRDKQVTAALTAWAGEDRAAVRGAQRRNAVVALPDPIGLQRPSVLARLASMDGDGFTLEATLENTGPLPVACLALAGEGYEVGLATAPTAQDRQRKATRTRGLRPEALLAFTWGFAASAVPKEYGRLCVGAASRDGDTGCISWALRGRPPWPLRPSARPSPGAFIEVIDTTSDGLHAQAALDRITSGGFSLDWRLADESPREFAFVGFGSRARRRLRDRAGVRVRLRRPRQ